MTGERGISGPVSPAGGTAEYRAVNLLDAKAVKAVIDEIANAAFFFGLMAGMSEKYEDVTELIRFADVKTNFLAAARDGRVNLSPKGRDTFRVLDGTRVAWMNLTGSGNETVAVAAMNADTAEGA